MKFSDMKGKTLVSVVGLRKDSDDVIFTTDQGEEYRMLHYSDCCESVYIEDVCGDVDDIIGSPILVAEEVQSRNELPKEMILENLILGDTPATPGDSFTWTFYKLDTLKGSVVIRWLGESNGYYSESVNFEKL